MALAEIPPDDWPSPADYERDMAILNGMSKPGKRRNGTHSTTPQQRTLIESADAFIARYVPVDYIIDGFLIRGYLYGLTSRSNHGKTTVGTAIAVHIATSTPLAGMEVSGGRVLLMYGENSENSRQQLIAALQHFDLTAGNIDIISRAMPLADNIDQILAECKDDYAFVLVDSSAAYFSYTDENDNVANGNHARDLRRLTELKGSPAVMVLCHPTKAADRDTLAPRGGGAFENELDTSLRLWKTDTTTELYPGNKVRGPLLDALTFDLKPHTLTGYTDKKGRAVIVPVSDPMGDTAAAAHHRQMIESDNRLLYAMLHNASGSISDWASECGWLTSTGKPYKSKVQRSLERLQGDKLAHKTRKGYELTASGKAEAKEIR